jgi:hypothetical protein
MVPRGLGRAFSVFVVGFDFLDFVCGGFVAYCVVGLEGVVGWWVLLSPPSFPTYFYPVNTQLFIYIYTADTLDRYVFSLLSPNPT